MMNRTTTNYRLGFLTMSGDPVLYDRHYATEAAAQEVADDLGAPAMIFRVTMQIEHIGRSAR